MLAWFVVLSWAAAGFAVCLVGCRAGKKLPDRNVILISIDSLRYDHLGSYGYDKPTSPRIDAWGREALRFEYAYATSPWTLPSHASMFTGLYADTHGVRNEKSKLNEGFATLPRALSQAGYRTAGVVCAPLLKKRYGMHQGFDEYDVELIGKNALEARAVKVAPTVTKKALAWIDKNGGKPFFLFLHYWDVHYDYNPPRELVDLFDPGYQGEERGLCIYDRKDITPAMDKRDLQHLVALYDGEIRFTDDALGVLFDGLAARGLDENTAIVLTSDHGEEFLEHGWKGHSRTCYEEVVRVPFFAKVPWLQAARGVSKTPVSLVDIFPTVLGLLGRPKEGYKLQGADLSRLLAHGTSPPPRTLVAGTHRGQPIPDGKGYNWTVLLAEDRHKMHRLSRKQEKRYRLFDLEKDAAELHDLSRDDTVREVRNSMRREIERRRKLHTQLRKVVKAGSEAELDPELAATLKGLGYLN